MMGNVVLILRKSVTHRSGVEQWSIFTAVTVNQGVYLHTTIIHEYRAAWNIFDLCIDPWFDELFRSTTQ